MGLHVCSDIQLHPISDSDCPRHLLKSTHLDIQVLTASGHISLLTHQQVVYFKIRSMKSDFIYSRKSQQKSDNEAKELA